VLCTFNGAKFLKEQVDSILNQTYRSLELIISDDASEDTTPELLQSYESNPVVRVFYHKKNIGLSGNFSFAAGQARGELIAFSDQDDIWLPEKIEKLVTALGTSNLVYSDSLLVDEKGESMNKKLSDLKKMYSGDDSRGYFLYSCVWGHGMLITKELLERSLPIPKDVHHDIWISFMAFQQGGIKYLDEVLTHYRRHQSSASETLPEKNSERIRDDRATAFAKKLRWLELMQQYERPAFQPFYTKLLKLYSDKKRRKYVFPLVGFMLKFRKEFFMYSKKGFVSHFVEILKQARGERAA
jgi:glycosyltransferase involved in cell wall biosynthesis